MQHGIDKIKANRNITNMVRIRKQMPADVIV